MPEPVITTSPAVTVHHNSSVTRTVDLPPDLGLFVPTPYLRDVRFRAAQLVETLALRIDRRGEPDLTYEVRVKGPRQTGKGRDHASLRDDRTWRPGADVSTLRAAQATLPPELAPHTVGPDALMGPLFAAHPLMAYSTGPEPCGVCALMATVCPYHRGVGDGVKTAVVAAHPGERQAP